MKKPKQFNERVLGYCYWFLTLLSVGKNITFTFMLPCIVIDFFLNNQPDALIIQILFGYKTLHVSDIFSARHQEFPTVHSALVSFMQVFDDLFQAESGWNCSSILTLHRKPEILLVYIC